MTSALSLAAFDAIIFDLGGVILELHPEATIKAFSALYGSDAHLAYTQSKQQPLFDEFERGELSATDFRAKVTAFFGAKSPVPEADFDRAWNAMLGTIPAENLQLLQTLGQSKRVFLLSNTNEIHVAQFLRDYASRHQSSQGAWEDLFETAHYSHDLGMRKPEARIYQALIQRHGLTPSRTVFIDDNQSNIESAARCGLMARLHQTNAPLREQFLLAPEESSDKRGNDS